MGNNLSGVTQLPAFLAARRTLGSKWSTKTEICLGGFVVLAVFENHALERIKIHALKRVKTIRRA
jgi:hypothetical protein